MVLAAILEHGNDTRGQKKIHNPELGIVVKLPQDFPL
jgi:hypothetical protein